MSDRTAQYVLHYGRKYTGTDLITGMELLFSSIFLVYSFVIVLEKSIEYVQELPQSQHIAYTNDTTSESECLLGPMAFIHQDL